MIKLKLCYLFVFLLSMLARAQSISNGVIKLAHYNNPDLPKVDGTDIWNDITGWYDPIKQKEYAICGTTDSIYFFDVSNPTDLKLIQVKSGRSISAKNRDFETFSHYVYCVSDQARGDGRLQVFDLQYLPDSVHEVYASSKLGKYTHTIFVDSVLKRLYMCSNTLPIGFSAMDVLSIEKPDSPSFLFKLAVPVKPTGGYLFNKVHEMFARNDTCFLSAEYNGIYFFRLTDAQNQAILGSITSYPEQGYNHSSWLDKSGKYLMFTDEESGLDIKIFDITNYSNPKFVSSFNSSDQAMPHNAYWLGDFAYVSSYHDGFVVYNIKEPSNPHKVAWYDTHPVEPEIYGGFKGCWGIYPYLPSKIILASDLTNGIYVLKIDSQYCGMNEQKSAFKKSAIYPNPATNELHIEFNDLQVSLFSYEIYNTIGMLIKSDVIANKTAIDISDLNTGSYILHLNTGTLNTFQSFIKQP